MFGNRSAHATDDTPSVRGIVHGIAGRELRGTFFALAGSAAPSIAVYDGDVPLGTVEVLRSDRGPGRRLHEAAWSFTFALPVELYDGSLHLLRAAEATYPDAFDGEPVPFIGDPALSMPHRRSPHALALRDGARRDDALAVVMQNLRVQTAALAEVLRAERASNGHVPHAAGGALTLAERYGAPVGEASHPEAADVIWLGIIDWDFRIQRPQHLAAKMADQRSRVFYVSIEFEPADERGRFRILSVPHPGVYEVRLRLSGSMPAAIYAGFTPGQVADLAGALDEMIDVLHVEHPNVMVQFPSWYPLACGIAGATIVHDCLDLVSGFNDTAPAMVALEHDLVRDADLVVVSSEPLLEHVREQRDDAVLIRNAADVDFFAHAADRPLPRSGRATIGYIGAISYWYEIDWIAFAAKARPDWDFVLVGGTAGCDTAVVQGLANVTLLGERPYAELPARLSEIDVGIIPFKLTDLIKCTNPVKLYEYMAAGKPVIASPMPEVISATDLAYIASDAEEFVACIDRALREDTAALRAQRRSWALGHTWTERADRLLDAIGPLPAVSVVILAYNNWEFTKTCLDSVLRFSEYPDLEVIVVDNGSTDGTPEHLRRMQHRDPRVQVVINEANLGFAGGNNAGILRARGEFVILLNNDTYVTRGWVRDLVRPLQRDRGIGIVAPVTNNMGNEQKVRAAYSDMHEMAAFARGFTRRHLRERFETSTVAFFCVALRREVIDRVGLLDESYGVGFYEDDDYCRRVGEAGYRIVIADDVFVHHHLSASFNALGAERKQEQMERNRKLYESRWGPWQPHTYRDAPEFG